MIIAFGNLLNTVLSYFNINTTIISFLVSIGILPILFLYITSYVFKFCIYHRLFLHYIVVNNIICAIDELYYPIPVSNRGYLMIHFIVAGVFLFLILFTRNKCKIQQKVC